MVVPDHKTLERAQRAVEAVVEPQLVARLHSEDKPTPRYRAFVQALPGELITRRAWGAANVAVQRREAWLTSIARLAEFA